MEGPRGCRRPVSIVVLEVDRSCGRQWAYAVPWYRLAQFRDTYRGAGSGGAAPRVLGRQLTPPPPLGASGQQLVGGVVGVQNRGVASPMGAGTSPCGVYCANENCGAGNFRHPCKSQGPRCLTHTHTALPTPRDFASRNFAAFLKGGNFPANPPPPLVSGRYGPLPLTRLSVPHDVSPTAQISTTHSPTSA